MSTAWITAGFVVVVTSIAVVAWWNSSKKSKKDDDDVTRSVPNFLSGKKKQRQRPIETWESKIPKRINKWNKLHNNLWILETSGAEYGPPVRNMIVYRNHIKNNNNELLIFNGIAVDDNTLNELLNWGEPTILIVPNQMHRDGCGVWKQKFPNLIVLCPSVATEAANEIVDIDGTTQEWFSADPWCPSSWKDCVKVLEIDGWKPFETIMQVQLTSDGDVAWLMADLLFTLPRNPKAGLMEKLMNWIFDSSIDFVPEVNPNQIIIPKISRVARWIGIDNFNRAADWYEEKAKTVGEKLQFICVGHGPPVTKGAKVALQGVATQLRDKNRW